MVLAKHGEVDEIYHISSGAPATPTILGKFRFYRKDAGYNSLGMYYSAYFIRGYATHGYHFVPTTRRATAACGTRSPTRSTSTTGSTWRPHLRLS